MTSCMLTRHKSDPALPSHFASVATALRERASAAAAEEDYLLAIKLKLRASVVAQEEGRELEQCAIGMRSLAQVRHKPNCNYWEGTCGPEFTLCDAST